MSDHGAPTEACRDYAAAYSAHYSGRDLAMAIQLYMKIVAAHAGTPEAGYSETQVRNIVSTVVPRQELLEAQSQLALAHLGRRT